MRRTVRSQSHLQVRSHLERALRALPGPLTVLNLVFPTGVTPSHRIDPPPPCTIPQSHALRRQSHGSRLQHRARGLRGHGIFPLRLRQRCHDGRDSEPEFPVFLQYESRDGDYRGNQLDVFWGSGVWESDVSSTGRLLDGVNSGGRRMCERNGRANEDRGGLTMDSLGRRWTVLVGAVINLVGAAMQSGAQNLAMILVGRILAGWAVGVLSMSVPIYQSECAHPSKRGMNPTYTTLKVDSY